MKLLDELKEVGVDVWLDENGKLRYRGRQSSAAVSSLLEELKTQKEQVIAYLQANRMDSTEAIKLAWRGELKRAVLIAPREEWRELWGGAVWLCPDDASKARIRRKYPESFALTAKEFFSLCNGMAKGENIGPVLKCLRLFGGSLEKTTA